MLGILDLMSGSYTAYPMRFENEIWAPPKWVYAKGVSLSSGKAAKFLGLHRYTLVQKPMTTASQS
jgi:hypothetical protein